MHDGSQETLIPFIPLDWISITTDSMSLACCPRKTLLGGLPVANLVTSFREMPPQPITSGPRPPPPPLVGSTIIERLVLA